MRAVVVVKWSMWSHSTPTTSVGIPLKSTNNFYSLNCFKSTKKKPWLAHLKNVKFVAIERCVSKRISFVLKKRSTATGEINWNKECRLLNHLHICSCKSIMDCCVPSQRQEADPLTKRPSLSEAKIEVCLCPFRPRQCPQRMHKIWQTAPIKSLLWRLP